MKSYRHCISFIQIVSPTHEKIIEYQSDEIRKFHTTFLNSMGQIVIKDTAHGLLSYFPQTRDPTNISAIKDVIECCLQQIEKRQSLSIETARQQLPEISYKVTADYEIYIEYEPSDEIELPSYEALAADLSMYKMSSRTSTNTVVLGDDLYKMKSTSPLL